MGDALRGDSVFTQRLLHAGFLPSSGGAVLVQADMFSQGLHLVSQDKQKKKLSVGGEHKGEKQSAAELVNWSGEGRGGHRVRS